MDTNRGHLSALGVLLWGQKCGWHIICVGYSVTPSITVITYVPYTIGHWRTMYCVRVRLLGFIVFSGLHLKGFGSFVVTRLKESKLLHLSFWGIQRSAPARQDTSLCPGTTNGHQDSSPSNLGIALCSYPLSLHSPSSIVFMSARSLGRTLNPYRWDDP